MFTAKPQHLKQYLISINIFNKYYWLNEVNAREGRKPEWSGTKSEAR